MEALADKGQTISSSDTLYIVETFLSMDFFEGCKLIDISAIGFYRKKCTLQYCNSNDYVV